MKKRVFKGALTLLLLAMVISIGKYYAVKAEQDKTDKTIKGDEYQFTDSEQYNIDEKTPIGKTKSYVSNSFGELHIIGEYESMGEISKDVKAYNVKSGNIQLKYDFDKSKLNFIENGYNLCEDGCEEVNGYDIDEDIDYGAILVQTSFDGVKWITDKAITNVFVQNSILSNAIYETSNIQLVNGCYYRIIVAYEERKKVDSTNLYVTTIDNYDYRRWAEVYTFYAINKAESEISTSPSDVPRKELGQKIRTERNTGYSGNITIDASDPHIGWDIGTFVVNGYTRETKDALGDSVFLKTVGDRVTLWFNLKQDINCLNGNSDLKIESNNGAYDQYFEVPKTDFRRGTLIIRFTDHEGKKTNPIIYTNYLEANTRTGAYTKVELFEEGDYEVALDYSIDDSTSIVSKNKDYRIFFKFSIRNGNTMIFPFDITTQDELGDNSITENGFKLDLARSRYLDIDVKRNVLTKSNGVYTEDTRFNGPATDGAIYNEEGIYRLSVKNKYTNESTEKTIYVGTSSVYKALAKNNSLAEINQLLSEGGEIDEYGNIVMPVIEPEITEPVVTPDISDKNDKGDITIDSDDKNIINSNDEKKGDITSDVESDNTESDGAPIGLIVAIVVIVLGGATFAWYYFTKIKSKNNDSIAVVAPQPIVDKLKGIESGENVMDDTDVEKNVNEEKENINDVDREE